MQHAGRQPHLRASGDQLAQRPLTRPVGQAVIGARRQQHADLHTAPARQAPGVKQGIVRDKVRRHGADALLRLVGARHQQGMHGVVGMVGPAGHPLHQRALRRRGSAGQQRRTVKAQRPTTGGMPVGAKLRLRLRRQRAMDDEAQILPSTLARIPGEILRRQVAPTAPQPHAIGHRHFAVVAQIAAPMQRVAQQRHKAAHPHPRAQPLVQLAPWRHEAAHRVQQQPCGDTTLHAAHQRRRDGPTNSVVAIQKSAQLQRVLGRIDQVQQRLQRGGATFLKLDIRVALGGREFHARQQARGPGRRTGRDRSGQALRRKTVARRTGIFARTKKQKQRQRDVRKRHHAQHPGQRRRRMAVLVANARGQHIDQQTARHQQRMAQAENAAKGPHGWRQKTGEEGYALPKSIMH